MQDGNAFTLALAGDVMLGRLVDRALASRGPEWPWRHVKPWVDAADAFFFNQEFAICGADVPEWEPERKTFHFRLDPAHRDAVKASGVDAVCLANNHAMDHGEEGLLETLRHLDDMGVKRAGAGRDLAEARAPATVDVKGTRVALLSFADHLEEWAAGPDTPGINWVPVSTREKDFAPVRDAIADAREAADVVVFGIHWGPNMRAAPPPHFREFARAVVDAGADVFYGHSAHVFQAMDVHAGKPVLYDTGDFVDDYAVDEELRNDVGWLYRLAWRDGAFRDVRAHATCIRDFCTSPAQVKEREWAVARLKALSEDVGAVVREVEPGVVALDRMVLEATRGA